MKLKIKGYALRDLTLDGIDEEKRELRFTFMTEAPCDNWLYPEICKCGPENVDLTRFENGVMPVLFNHDRDRVIGKVDTVVIEDGRAIATVTIDDDEKSEVIFNKIKKGSLKGVSVGYRRIHTVRVQAGQTYEGQTFDVTTDVTDRWQPYEVSIVSCPADPDCGVGRSLEEIEVEVQGMQEETNTEEPTPASAEKEIVQEERKKEMNEKDIQNEKVLAEKLLADERARVKEVSEMCNTFHVDAAIATKYLSDGEYTVDRVRKEILDDMAKKQAATNIKVTGDEKEKFHEKAIDGLALQYGLVEEKDAVDGANEYRAASVRSIAEDCLINGGMSERKLRHLSSDEVFALMFNGDRSRAMGTEGFLSVVDGFSNKAMLKGYKEQPTIFRNFVSKGTNKDFKAAYKYRLGLDGEPELMPAESAEFPYQEMADERVQTSIQTYGKAISFTREIFINDDMGVIVKAIQRQAAGFERLHEKMFFALLTGNKDLFSKKHGNLVETNKDISTKAYSEMRKLMHGQKDAEGNGFVGVFPAFILASDEHEMEHATLIHSASEPSQQNPGVINTMQNKLVLFTSPYIDGNAYYAIARPTEMEGIEYTTLNGIDRPFSRTVAPQNHLGIDYQFWQDFGFNLIDYRAFVKNAGE